MKPEDSLKDNFTEEEARAIFRHWNNDSRTSIEAFVDMCKKRGWIKKSALEDAREFFENNKDFSGVSGDMFNKLQSLYEKAIEEIKNS